MSAGWILPGFGASSLRSLTKTNAPIHIYISATRGSDTTGLGTQAKPLATLGMLDALLPDDIAHPVDVSLDAGVHLLPDTGVWLHARIMNNILRIYGDAVWDPSVNQVLRSEPAGAGTTANVIKQTGLPINLFRGKTLEVTTAGGVVQRKTIKSNTVTDIIPCEVFNPAPAPGDQVRITQSMAAITAPTITGTFELYKLSRDWLTSRQSPFSGDTHPASVQQVGMVLENLALEPSASFQGWSLGLGLCYIYGLELRRTDPNAFTAPLTLLGAQIFVGRALNGQDNDIGFGISVTNFGPFSAGIVVYADGTYNGYFVGECPAPVAQTGGSVFLWSGFSRAIIISSPGSFRAFGNTDSTIPFTAEDLSLFGGVQLRQTAQFGTVVGPAVNLCFAADVTSPGPGLVVYNGGVLSLDSLVTGGSTGPSPAVDVRAGGRVYVDPNPQYGGPAGLWKTTNTVGVTRAAFVPGFALIDPTDGSAIIVVAP